MIAHPVILFYWVKKKTNYQLEFPKSLKQILLLIYQDLEVIFFELCQFKFNFLISSIFIIIAGLFGIFLAIVLANIALTPFVWYIASVISM